MNNETHIDASQKSRISSFVAIFGVFGPFLAFMGSKECPKGVHEVHRSYFYTAAILISNSSYTGGQNSCGATVPRTTVFSAVHYPRSTRHGNQALWGCAGDLPPSFTVEGVRTRRSGLAILCHRLET